MMLILASTLRKSNAPVIKNSKKCDRNKTLDNGYFYKRHKPYIMTTVGLKRNIHEAVEKIDDPEFLKAVYTILAEKLVDYNYALTPAQEAEIDKRIAAYKSGKSKSYGWLQAKKVIQTKLKK